MLYGIVLYCIVFYIYIYMYIYLELWQLVLDFKYKLAPNHKELTSWIVFNAFNHIIPIHYTQL